MKYLLLAYHEEKKWDVLSQSEKDEIQSQCAPHEEAFRSGGHLLAQECLQPIRNTTTVRLRNGKLSVTDGPFAETKEQVGGFYLIEARDLNEAIQVASKTAAAHLGEHLGWGIEIRPIEDKTGQS